MVVDDIRLTTDEIKKYCKFNLADVLGLLIRRSDEQIEVVKDFMALAAVITYEGLKKKLGLSNGE